MQLYYPLIIEQIEQGKYRKLGAGSGRYVYDMENNYVIKYGRNQKGLAQNQAEDEIYHKRRDPVLAAVGGCTSDYRILVMEKAEPYKNSYSLCQYYNISSMRELHHIAEVRRMVEEYHLVGVDLMKISSWGEVRGRPVLIDYGFTTHVRNRYYTGFF